MKIFQKDPAPLPMQIPPNDPQISTNILDYLFALFFIRKTDVEVTQGTENTNSRMTADQAK